MLFRLNLELGLNCDPFSGSSYNELHLMSDVCAANAAILSSAYPELGLGLDKVKLILEFELESSRHLEADGRKFWPNFVKEYPKVTLAPYYSSIHCPSLLSLNYKTVYRC